MRTRSLFRNVRQAFYGAKHNVERLEQHLVATFQQRKFGESETPLVIVSYNPSRPNPGLHLFKSNTERDSSRPAVDVALAATAAPTYFNARDLLLGTKYEALLDGGIAANCPVFVGLAEAVHTFHKNLGDVRILSIGTTYKPVVITRRQKTGGLSAYSRFGIILGLGLVDLLMSAQVATTVGTANFLLQDRFRRVTHQTEEEIKLDDIANMDKMVEWARDDAEKDMEAIQREFFA